MARAVRSQRLKRVFNIDIETCNSHCGGAVKIIACIEDPAVIETTAWMQEVEQRMEQLPKIRTHPNKQTASAKPIMWRESRAPPQAVLFGAPKGQINPRRCSQLKRQVVCRPEGWNWPEYGNALPYSGRAVESCNVEWLMAG